MNRTLLVAAALGAIFVISTPAEVRAQEQGGRHIVSSGVHGTSKYRKARKRGAKVYGYTVRRGGYSYDYSDVVNTYGLSRSLYGSTNVYRDPSLDRQTISGPFDHGFFFDSGIGPRGGDAPYAR